MQEHRQALRFGCAERLVCRAAGKEFEATVVDVSRGGMKIRCRKRLKVGNRLTLRPENKARGRAKVEAVVRWVQLDREGEVGLEFLDSAGKLARRWVRKLFPDCGGAWTAGKQQRSEVRAEARLPVVSTDGRLEGTTLDLSSSGVRVELSGRLSPQNGIILFLPGCHLEFDASELRWEHHQGKLVYSLQLSGLNGEQQQKLDSFVQDRTLAKAFEQHSALR